MRHCLPSHLAGLPACGQEISLLVLDASSCSLNMITCLHRASLPPCLVNQYLTLRRLLQHGRLTLPHRFCYAPQHAAGCCVAPSQPVRQSGICAVTEHHPSAGVQGVFAPPGGKRLVAFIDDLNMPQKSKFGFIPPLELLKLWIDYGFW